MAKFERHIFVCENERGVEDPRGSCRGQSIRAQLKELIKQRGLKRVVRANKAGCLDQCSHGVTVVVYPDAHWYGNVTGEDLPALLDAVERGEVLQRLVIPAEKLTGKTRRKEERHP